MKSTFLTSARALKQYEACRHVESPRIWGSPEVPKSELGGREIWPEPLKRTKPSLLKVVVLMVRRGQGRSSQRSGRTGVKPSRRKNSAKTEILSICLDPPLLEV